MKSATLISTLVLLTLAITGCNSRPLSPPIPAGAVVFQGAGVALVPGENWQQLQSGSLTQQGTNICLPVLLGEGELNGILIQVRSSPDDRSSPDKRAASLQERAALRPQVNKDSFKQTKFSTDSGLAGACFSFLSEIEVKGLKTNGQNRVYLVQNAQGSIVGLSVIAIASKDLEPVDQMIKKTLRLE